MSSSVIESPASLQVPAAVAIPVDEVVFAARHVFMVSGEDDEAVGGELGVQSGDLVAGACDGDLDLRGEHVGRSGAGGPSHRRWP